MELIPVIDSLLKGDSPWIAVSIILGFWGWFNQKKVYEVQEKRIEDNRTSIETLQASTNAATKMAEALTELSFRLERKGTI